MKIICTQREKDILQDIFNDEKADCPFNGDNTGLSCPLTKCSICIEHELNIHWEIKK